MNKIITISREYGAGGHSIGRQVAEQLGIPFYDRDIVRETVKASGFDMDTVEHDQEDVSRADFLLKSICSLSAPSYNDTQDAIHEVQRAVILQFAKAGPCVILGRCADDILRKAGVECLNVFIHADKAARVKRIVALGHCDEKKAPDFVTKKDKQRANYYNFYSNNRWDDLLNYDLTIDTSRFSVDLAVEMLIDAAKMLDK